MTPDEYGFYFMADLEAFDADSPRSRASLNGEIGASDLGTCQEKVRRTLAQTMPTDAPSKWQALLGTYVDGGVKRARQAAHPHLLMDKRLPVLLPNGLGFMVSLDELDPEEPSYNDVKTKDGLALVRRVGGGNQPRWQRHVCYLAAHQNDLVPAEGIVRNIYLDRSGKDRHPHVEQEPFSLDVVNEAAAWLEGAVYANEHGEIASKDWARPMCEQFCEHFTACRGGEPIEEEYLTGHRASILAEFYRAKKERGVIEALYDESRLELLGVTGRSDTHWVRSTVTNGKTASTRLDAGLIEEGAA